MNLRRLSAACRRASTTSASNLPTMTLPFILLHLTYDKYLDFVYRQISATHQILYFIYTGWVSHVWKSRIQKSSKIRYFFEHQHVTTNEVCFRRFKLVPDIKWLLRQLGFWETKLASLDKCAITQGTFCWEGSAIGADHKGRACILMSSSVEMYHHICVYIC